MTLPDSWMPLDMEAWLQTERQPVVPELGTRDDDGIPLLYLGKTHSLASESEAGKTWLMLHWCAQEMRNGHPVTFIDFEDSADGVVDSRLLDMVDEELIIKHFQYIRPDEALDDLSLIADMLEDSSLVILDGITEAMSLYGLNPLDNAHIATFNKILPNAISRLGAAVVSADHLVKNKENQGRYALGGVHKLNALSGASFQLRSVRPFGRGRIGSSRLLVGKDRFSHVKIHGNDVGGSLFHVADLILDNQDQKKPVQVCLVSPGGLVGGPSASVLEALSKTLEQAGKPLSKTDLANKAGGKKPVAMKGIDHLVMSGHFHEDRSGRAHMMTSVRPYREPVAKDTGPMSKDKK